MGGKSSEDRESCSKINGSGRKNTSLGLISVTILLKNTPLHLEEVLRAVQGFHEVLLYDNGASAKALEICRGFPCCKIIQGPFMGFGPTHNFISSLASNDWIFSIDSDEVVTEKLKLEIGKLSLNPTCVYSIPRHNEFNGKWIRYCGWYPDRVIRIYNRCHTQFSEALVHESILKGHLQAILLRSPLKHYSYECISDFLSKMQTYSDLFAKQNQGKKKSSLARAIFHAVAAFFKSYILKRGVLDGYEGFIISAYNAHTAFYKYLKLYELNSKIKFK